MDLIVIKYKIFTSSEEFEKWQIDNKISLLSITPIIAEASIGMQEGKDNTSNGELTTAIKVFVTYRDL